MATLCTILALIFGLALLITGGWLTFTRLPLAGIFFIVFGAFISRASLIMATSVSTSEGSPRERQLYEVVPTTPSPD